MNLIKKLYKGASNFLEYHKNQRDLTKIMKRNAKMDILKARLEAQKEKEIYIAKQKEKIKARRELEKYNKKLKNKKIVRTRYIKIILLLILILLLVYLLTYVVQ